MAQTKFMVAVGLPTKALVKSGGLVEPDFPLKGLWEPVGLSSPARSGQFVELDQADATCPVPLRKNISVPF
jgi:hypothetical protein